MSAAAWRLAVAAAQYKNRLQSERCWTGKLDLRHMKAGLTKLLVSRVPGSRRD
jgi:hypothetical protein